MSYLICVSGVCFFIVGVAGESALLKDPPAAGRFAGRTLLCRNVLFVCSVVCLFAGGRTETIPIVWFAGFVGLPTPTAVFVSCIMPISHSVTPDSDPLLSWFCRQNYQ